MLHTCEKMLVLLVPLVLMQAGAVLDSSPSYFFDWSPDGEPGFVDTPTHVRVKQGGLAILHCWVRQLGDRQVAWRRKSDDTFLTVGKVTLTKDPNVVLEHVRKRGGVSSWDLVFRRARREHQGLYECQLTSQRVYVRTVTLTVLDEPLYNTHMVVTAGQPLHLRCEVASFNVSTSALHWEKDGRHIDSILYPFIYITRYQIQYTRMLVSELSIDNVSVEDSGLYTCLTSSRHVLRVTKVTVNSAFPSTIKRDEDTAEEKLGQQIHTGDKVNGSRHDTDTEQSPRKSVSNSGSGGPSTSSAARADGRHLSLWVSLATSAAVVLLLQNLQRPMLPHHQHQHQHRQRQRPPPFLFNFFCAS
ncbi:zwei Ig domain protein zig-8-like [Babylonia areolata]|uniref:zwei Ig domain protein zig-8-like n=1 Tax=Babylonia areolata TaxID=304850 RepID=UPI003FD42CFD